MWYSSGSTVLKHRKRDNVYKNSTGSCMFYVDEIVAASFGHWKFVRKCSKTGLVVFNNYSYSVSTSGHQREVEKLMKTLGIKIDVTINTVESISENVSDSILSYIKKLTADRMRNELEMNRKGMSKKYKETRQDNIDKLNKEIKNLCSQFKLKVSVNDMLAIRENEIELLNKRLEQAREKNKTLRENKKLEETKHATALNDLTDLTLYNVNDEFNSLEQI